MDMNSSSGWDSASLMWFVMAIMVISEIAMWWMMTNMHKKMFARIEALEAALAVRKSTER